MKYKNIVSGIFLERPNRFIAYVDILGKKEKVHVKNTGRCQELLTQNAIVFLEKSDNPNRSTAYDLIAVKKGDRLINMDSQAPNKVVEEWLSQNTLFPDLVLLQREKTFGNSRFDFYAETKNERIFIEVKGVTLEENNMVKFPDAPSERAIKHIYELIQAIKNGYKAYIIFIVQLKKVDYFMPNWTMQPLFAQALVEAKKAGVNILAYDCYVNTDELEIADCVPVHLTSLGLMVSPLLYWYKEHKRILPWRAENPNPYYVWVSEIMLQQTRVEAVKPYFERFIEKLPGVERLANAKEEELLKLWEGLGYYNRVRNMQIAAKEIVESYAGVMPDNYEQLLSLKGIGSYTAGAIASIAYDIAVPAVDGNVLRVVTRILKDKDDIGKEKTKEKIWEKLNEIMPVKEAGNFNQALMELGATICIPKGAPLCDKCPVRHICQAYQENCVMEYPVKTPSKKRGIETKTVLVIEDKNTFVLQKRPPKGLLAGMYEFPMLDGEVTKENVIEFLKESGINLIRIKELESSKHIFTHKEWHMRGYSIKVDELEPLQNKGIKSEWIFVEKSIAKEEYPIPSAFRAYANFLQLEIGNAKVKKSFQGKEKNEVSSKDK